jgi:peptidoglycan/LPS O-acetylase OafA/YrhL/CubicO group peptidase (beta-lactamase class C family)
MIRTSPTSEHDEQPGHISYLPGLDGLRALAVVSVTLYHAGFRVAGGYLGVESFFALSGFLITALLLAEHQRRGTIHITGFWLRRARRLLPAFLVTVLGTLLLAAFLLPTELPALRDDALASLFYVMNWKLVASQQSYFDALARPSLLQHLWSLAVEEQFYVVWPLLFAAGMRLLGRTVFLAGVVAAALASAGLMSGWYEPGSDPSRIYYGTDTRASALLAGAALALVWTPERRAAVGHRLGLMLEAAGAGALVGLLAAYVWLYERHPLLYLGGFQLVTFATLGVIAATTYPGARVLPRLLDAAPLRWVGLRSYGLYLWHWPIFMVTRPGIDLRWDGWLVTVLRFGLTIGLAWASYRFIERPIRTRGFASWWGSVRSRTMVLASPVTRPAWRAAVLLGISVVAAILSAVMGQTARPQPAQHSVVTPLAPTMRPGRLVAVTPARDMTPTDPSDDMTVLPGEAGAVPNDRLNEVLPPPARPTSLSTAPLSTLDPVLTAELQHLLDDTVVDGFVPGAVMSVSVPGYAPWTGASGLADRDTTRPMQPDTPVRLGSVSKLFTAVVVLQLVEEDRITLDTPISTWLSDRVPDSDRITVRQLLQHTSGLYDYLEDRTFIAEMQRDPEHEWAPEELVGYASQFPPGPRGQWDYSSTNYVVLGMLVEQVTGQSLAAEMRQRVFEPLALQHTFVLPEEDAPPSLAHGYSQGTDITSASMSFAFATGNIVSTGDDLQRFGRALFAEELLKAETRDLMLQFVSGRGQYDMPALEYGLGVMRNQLPLDAAGGRDPRAGRVLGHIGGYGGFRTALWYAPSSGITIALSLNQSFTDPNGLAAQALDRTLAAIGQ